MATIQKYQLGELRGFRVESDGMGFTFWEDGVSKTVFGVLWPMLPDTVDPQGGHAQVMGPHDTGEGTGATEPPQAEPEPELPQKLDIVGRGDWNIGERMSFNLLRACLAYDRAQRRELEQRVELVEGVITDYVEAESDAD